MTLIRVRGYNLIRLAFELAPAGEPTRRRLRTLRACAWVSTCALRVLAPRECTQFCAFWDGGSTHINIMLMITWASPPGVSASAAAGRYVRSAVSAVEPALPAQGGKEASRA